LGAVRVKVLAVDLKSKRIGLSIKALLPGAGPSARTDAPRPEGPRPDRRPRGDRPKPRADRPQPHADRPQGQAEKPQSQADRPQGMTAGQPGMPNPHRSSRPHPDGRKPTGAPDRRPERRPEAPERKPERASEPRGGASRSGRCRRPLRRSAGRGHGVVPRTGHHDPGRKGLDEHEHSLAGRRPYETDDRANLAHHLRLCLLHRCPPDAHSAASIRPSHRGHGAVGGEHGEIVGNVRFSGHLHTASRQKTISGTAVAPSGASRRLAHPSSEGRRAHGRRADRGS